MDAFSISRDHRGDVLWNVDLVTVLEHHWNSGIPASEIAIIMGITKGAVIGKAHRENFKPRREHRPTLIGLDGLVYKPMTDPYYWKPLLDLQNDGCRYPNGTPREEGFAFCGAKIEPGRPYCTEHMNLCFVPAKKKAPGAGPTQISTMVFSSLLGRMTTKAPKS